MRPIRNITAEEENFRMVDKGWCSVIRRDPVEPEPIGTIVMKPFRIIGYDKDCDGSLMAVLEHLTTYGEDPLEIGESGWDVRNIGLYQDSLDFVVTEDELITIYHKIREGK